MILNYKNISGIRPVRRLVRPRSEPEESVGGAQPSCVLGQDRDVVELPRAGP